MPCFRQGKLFYVTSTTVTTTLTTSTLCFMKESCDQKDPFDPPGPPAAGAMMMSKMCAAGCSCAEASVMCPPGCFIPGSGPDPACATETGPTRCARCPAGCVPNPNGLPNADAIADPCNSCTISDPMANMMLPVCPGGKKKRAILDFGLPEEGLNISPSPPSQPDIER